MQVVFGFRLRLKTEEIMSRFFKDNSLDLFHKMSSENGIAINEVGNIHIKYYSYFDAYFLFIKKINIQIGGITTIEPPPPTLINELTRFVSNENIQTVDDAYGQYIIAE